MIPSYCYQTPLNLCWCDLHPWKGSATDSDGQQPPLAFHPVLTSLKTARSQLHIDLFSIGPWLQTGLAPQIKPPPSHFALHHSPLLEDPLLLLTGLLHSESALPSVVQIPKGSQASQDDEQDPRGESHRQACNIYSSTPCG